MRLLVVGGGGREHAIIWKLAQNNRVSRIYCAPGNAGIGRQAECIKLKATDVDALGHFAESERIDLTIVGPEAALATGIVDRFEARGLPIFGPSTDPARLETSKIFAKEVMQRYNIPTADFWVFDKPNDAHQQIRRYYTKQTDAKQNLVVKADGIAAGKGVIVASNESEAHQAVDTIMVQRAFGGAGDRIVLEERLYGREVSIMAFTDGETVIPMPPSQDHKRAFDNDQGPNTGGMGAFAPVPCFSSELLNQALESVLKPAIFAIRDLGIPYKGVLYAGIILTSDGMKTLEFNCRFGDPETQAVLPLLETDLLEVMQAVVECSLDKVNVTWKAQSAVCVVAASQGYPGDPQTGCVIDGLDKAASLPDTIVFHAGTQLENGQFVTSGGRVLGVTGLGENIKLARERTYDAIEQIDFDGMIYRRDIAASAAVPV